MSSTVGPTNHLAASVVAGLALEAGYMVEFLERSVDVRSLTLTNADLALHLAEQVVLDHGGLPTIGLGIPVVANPTLAPGMEPGQPRRCFANAYAAMRSKTLYTEGWAAVPGPAAVPVHHAWLTTHDGRIFDPTWSEDFAGRATHYLGVRFSPEFMHQHHADWGGKPVLEMNVRLLENGLAFDTGHVVTGYGLPRGSSATQHSPRASHRDRACAGAPGAPATCSGQEGSRE